MSPRSKSNKANKPTVREATVAYETHSIAEVFWIAFQSLSQEQQGAFLNRLLRDPEVYEDIADTMLAIEREAEPSRPYEEFEAELIREGRL